VGSTTDRKGGIYSAIWSAEGKSAGRKGELSVWLYVLNPKARYELYRVGDTMRI